MIKHCALPSCNKEFEAKVAHAKCCSPECRTTLYLKEVRGCYNEVEKICAHKPCSKQFKTTKPKQKFCTPECWTADKKVPEITFERVCLNCPTPFTTTASNQKFCTPKCTNAFNIKARAVARPERNCKHEPCSKPFTPFGPQLYCTSKCRDEAHKGKAIGTHVETTCRFCKRVFSANVAGNFHIKAFCKEECFNAHKAEKLRKQRAETAPTFYSIICEHCGKSASIQENGGARQKYCSDKCRTNKANEKYRSEYGKARFDVSEASKLHGLIREFYDAVNGIGMYHDGSDYLPVIDPTWQKLGVAYVEVANVLQLPILTRDDPGIGMCCNCGTFTTNKATLGCNHQDLICLDCEDSDLCSACHMTSIATNAKYDWSYYHTKQNGFWEIPKKQDVNDPEEIRQYLPGLKKIVDAVNAVGGIIEAKEGPRCVAHGLDNIARIYMEVCRTIRWVPFIADEAMIDDGAEGYWNEEAHFTPGIKQMAAGM